MFTDLRVSDIDHYFVWLGFLTPSPATSFIPAAAAVAPPPPPPPHVVADAAAPAAVASVPAIQEPETTFRSLLDEVHKALMEAMRGRDTEAIRPLMRQRSLQRHLREEEEEGEDDADESTAVAGVLEASLAGQRLRKVLSFAHANEEI